MRDVFYLLKNGKLSYLFLKEVKALEKSIEKRGGSKHLPTELIAERRIQDIRAIFTSLRFVFSFIPSQWREYKVLIQCMDKLPVNKELKRKSRLKKFKEFFKHLFKDHLDEEYKKVFKNFSTIEILRLDEALVTLQAGAYYSSIVMSVSAVEARLHKTVSKKFPKLYKKNKLDTLTLGQLFSLINSDKKYQKIKEKLPQKYSTVITACNEYRIFSAHPKEETMSYTDAVSIFTLTISFLLEVS